MIVVFDAMCPLCCGSVQFLLARDRQHRLRFSTIQTGAGKALLDRAGIDALAPDTFLLVDGERMHVQSDAVLRIADVLGWPWRLARVFWIVPSPLRDSLYRWIARNRYRWFGRHQTCWLPDDDHAHTTLFQSLHLINSPNFDDLNSMSYHPSGSNYLFGDGSVKYLKL
ncbi:MAG: DCC1-like thiol-disulfide oxidoreductase family protein, partial [Dokdonella sp.]